MGKKKSSIVPHKKFEYTHGKAILIVFPKEESKPVLQVELSWLCFLWGEK
jgi:hypothetical protein